LASDAGDECAFHGAEERGKARRSRQLAFSSPLHQIAWSFESLKTSKASIVTPSPCDALESLIHGLCNGFAMGPDRHFGGFDHRLRYATPAPRFFVPFTPQPDS
jgi:hypothetical protein